MPYPKVIFLDLDDTISSFDSVCEPAWDICCQQFVAQHQTEFCEVTLHAAINNVRKWYWSDPVRHKIGRENLLEARRDVVRYALKQLGITEEEKVIQLADHYTGLQDSMIALLPGAKEALEYIRGLGIPMAVITNGGSQVQREKIERLGIKEYFQHIFIDSEIGFSKPSEGIYRYALEQMNCQPSQAWMVGDNLDWDVFGAMKMGMFGVWNDYQQKGLPAGCESIPDLTVNSIWEMTKYIKNNIDK